MKLTGKQLKQFSEALMDAFPKKTNLAMMLRYELDWKLNQISYGDNYSEIVFKLIEYAESQEKLEQLLKAAISYNTGNTKLKIFAHSIDKNIVTEEEKNKLQSILEEIELQIVQSSYLKILPKNFKKDNIDLCNPKDEKNIIKILSENYTKTSEGIPSLVKLVEQIVNNINNKNSVLHEKLIEWLNLLASRLKIEICYDDKSENQIEQVDNNSYLICIIDAENKGYRLKAMYNNNKKLETLDDLVETDNKQRKGILCSSPEQIYEYIDKIIKYFLKNVNDNLEIIEIYLPYQLMYTNFKDCEIKDDFDDNMPIFTKFQIIVHSSDRITGEMNLKCLNQGWKNLLNFIKDRPSEVDIKKRIQTIKNNKLDWKEIQRDLKNQIGIKLSVPLTENQAEQDKFIKTILKEGIPFAFWLQCKPSRNISLKSIDDCLTLDYLENYLQKLIDEVNQKRSDAYNSKQANKELGYHLGFLHDVPDKIRKMKPLQSQPLKFSS